MAIVINGIDMPETCSDCMFENCNPDEREFSLCCLIMDNTITDGVRETGRLDNCPLRKVTEPKPRESRIKLPCPKCGTPRPEMLFIAGAGKTYAGIRCRKCEYSRYGDTEIAAIRAWNANAEKREG